MLPALDLTDEQTANVLALFGGAEAFIEWQRTALRSEIERRAARTASDTANAEVAAAVAEAVAGAGLTDSTE